MIMPIKGGLDACKMKCSMNKDCTAIEYSNNAPPVINGKGVKCCVLRKCRLPVPNPQVVQAKWHGGRSKYDGYVKRKYNLPKVICSQHLTALPSI